MLEDLDLKIGEMPVQVNTAVPNATLNETCVYCSTDFCTHLTPGCTDPCSEPC